MPRYYFDTSDGVSLVQDEIGVECASLPEVKRTAVEALPELAREALPDGDNLQMAVLVRDLEGRHILKVSLTLAVRWSDPAHVHGPN